MFCHLHVHSPFSFLDGASRADELIEEAAKDEMASLAITDHNTLSGAVRFVKKAKKAGIKPIVGAEITLKGGHHLTLLCEDKEGYKNLCSILTSGHLLSPRGEPQVAMETLRENSGGLIALTGCRKGLVPGLILKKRFGDAREALRQYKDIFRRNALFLEMSETLLPGSTGLNQALAELASSEGLGLVATNNVHYARKEDFFLHDLLTCIRTLTKVEEVHPERRLNAENYLKTSAEMEKEFRNYPGALRSAYEISGRCQCPIDLSESHFPAFKIPDGFQSANAYLRHLVYQGALDRYGRTDREVSERLEHELSVIEKLGYEDYFLVVWDLVRFARESGIRHAGRGSAADSAVAYCLHVTDVDPIAQNLLFERFMSVERGEKPDIDVDFDSRYRDKVTEYVYGKYGYDHVGSVATYNTFLGRSAIRDAGKALGFAPEEIDAIAKRIPHYTRSLEEAFRLVPELEEVKLPENKMKALLCAADRLTGLPRFLATHLGGVVISKNPITWLSPIQRSAKGVTIVQFDKDDVEDLGLVKIDLLSLRTLGAIEDSLGYIREKTDLDYDAIPLDDKRTYQRLNAGDTVGIFQLESPAQRSLQARLGADNIEDVVASVAIIRPGPIKGDMVEPFIRRRQGLEEVVYLEPRLEPILKKTYGVILFQEQVIEIASKIAGFTPGEADSLRRVMTHGRSHDEMERIGQIFVEKAVQSGVSQEIARKIFDCMRGYASYGFCEAHARAFGTTAYKTAYLIEHHPAEFFAAILNNEPMGFYPVSTVCVEARRHGAGVLGPDVNRSSKDVSVEAGSIRLPLKMIDGLSAKTIDAIVREREERGPFKSFEDFCSRVRPNSKEMRSLILCGAFDDFGISRKKLVWMIPSRYEDYGLDSGEILLRKPVDDAFADLDFTLEERIAFEYEILGLGISGHPMGVWRNTLNKKGFIRSSDLQSMPPGDFVKVAGIPVRPHRPPTKSGKTVVFLSLEDENGLIDVTCFESTYKKYGKYLFPGELIPLGIWGEVQKRGNALSVTARTVFPLSYVLAKAPGSSEIKRR